MLWAVERQLDARVGHAVMLAALACLLRPELVPFLGLYGLWVWRAERRLRPLLAGVLMLLPLAWVGPDWIASGMPVDGGAQARSEPAWSLSLAEHPWLRALERVHNHAGLAPSESWATPLHALDTPYRPRLLFRPNGTARTPMRK